MDTLNAIAENIAYQLGDQFNMTLRESIKDTIIIYIYYNILYTFYQ